MSYHVDRLYAAISVLVTHGPVKQRLIQAYEDNLDDIKGDELPVDVQETFAELRRQMHHVAPTNGEGSICASVRKMSKQDTDECARRIVEIYGEVVRQADADKQQPPVPMRGKKAAAAVPPFLVKSV
jgi:hypothetical protein